MTFESLLGDVQTLLAMPFFQRALIGGCLVSIICATIGLFIVLRKESMIGDSAAHISFGGIALGLLLGIEPILTALLLSTLAVLGMGYMKKKGIAQSDSAMAVMMAIGFSIGLVAIGLSNGFSISIMDYLFGSILTISTNDLILISILGLSVMLVFSLLFKELIAMTFDETSSKLNGIPVDALSMVFNILLAITVVLTIKVVGIILVVALLVIPALAALQLNISFRRTLLAGMAFAVIGTITGVMVSSLVDLPTAGVIVFTDVLIMIFMVAYRRLG